MNLESLMESHGRFITTKKKGYKDRYYDEKKFAPGSKEELEKLVVAWFSQQGWKSKQCKATGAERRKNPDATRNGYISRKGKHHTKITWRFYDGYNRPICNAKMHKKTANGGWTVDVYNNADLDALVKRAMNIPAPTLVSRETLPDPFVVGKYKYMVTRDKTIIANNKWRWVTAKGVVGLDKDGSINEQKAYNPKEKDLWFHCVVGAHDGSTSHIITDGEILHPVKSRGKLRVTATVPDLVEKTTTFDKELLQKAITMLFERQDSE